VIKTFGVPYTIVLILLVLGVIMDVVSFIKCRKLSSSDLYDYAKTFIKYLKIAVTLIFSAIMLYIAFTADISAGYKAMHIAIGALLIADSAVCLYIKLKYGKKR
jgi:hypothetical protein